MEFNNILKTILAISVIFCTSTMSIASIATDAKLQYNKRY